MTKSNRDVKQNSENLGTQGMGVEDVIYERRFTAAEDARRQQSWRDLCHGFFQKYVDPESSLLDLGAGDGLFLRYIQAKRKVAVDLGTHVHDLARYGIDVHCQAATDFAEAIGDPVDKIFMSNFLEHLPDKRTLIRVLEECHKALLPQGEILILQPNIRYVGAAYWDYIDHHIALTEHSLVEAADIAGFDTLELIPRFLPYTQKSSLGKLSFLVPLYLRLPWAWRFFGQQTFLRARKRQKP